MKGQGARLMVLITNMSEVTIYKSTGFGGIAFSDCACWPE
jgi:hypothetical protein